jgi:ribosomal protein L37E
MAGDDLGDGYGYQERRGKGWKQREAIQDDLYQDEVVKPMSEQAINPKTYTRCKSCGHEMLFSSRQIGTGYCHSCGHAMLPYEIKRRERAEAELEKRKKREWISVKDELPPIAAWSEQTGIHPKTIQNRLSRYGWTVEQALTLPLRRGKKPCNA